MPRLQIPLVFLMLSIQSDQEPYLITSGHGVDNKMSRIGMNYILSIFIKQLILHQIIFYKEILNIHQEERYS